jgi:rare lipoprotein A
MRAMNQTSAVLAVAASLTATIQPLVYASEAVSGTAEIYSNKFQGKKTASGQKYDMNALTAASNKFPLGSTVLVTEKKSGKTVTVKIIDIEAKRNKNILDLSKAAAARLGASTGQIPVEAKLVGK